MARKRTGEETKQLILDSCGAILRQQGAKSLTLDAVAAEAGLSKGGLLYHFATKEALLTNLFEHFMSPFDQYLATVPGLADTEYLLAYMDATVEQIEDEDTIGMIASLFAAGEEFPQLHTAMQRRYLDWQDKIAQGTTDPIIATAVRLAVDGLWFSAVYNYAPPDNAQRKAIVDMLRTIVEQN